MTWGRRRQDRGYPLPGSTGWLFADLMLALLVAIAVMVAAAQPTPSAPPPPRKPPPSTVPPTTSTTPARERLAREPIKFDVFVDDVGLLTNNPAAVAAAQDATRQSLALLGGRRAGLALTFGAAPSSDIQHGIRVAGQFNELVLRGMGEQFQDCAYRNFFQGGRELHKVTVEVFVFEN